MPAYLALLAAILSRLLPHALHGVGLNVTAVGGALLFFGTRQPRREILFAAAALAATDVYLTSVVFRYPFALRDYAVTWLWYAAVPLLGRSLLGSLSKPGASTLWLRSLAAVFASATSFFLLSNAVVWALGDLYPRTAAGLIACYAAALPFYANDMASTAVTVGILIGVPALAYQLAPQRLPPHDPA